MSYNPWGHKGSDKTERLTHTRTCTCTHTHMNTHTRWLNGTKNEEKFVGVGREFLAVLWCLTWVMDCILSSQLTALSSKILHAVM